MYKQSGRVLRNSEGRVFRFIDSSIFTISMNAVNKGVEFRFTTASDAVVKIGFGDGMYFSTTTVANVEKVISHGYTNIVGQTFKITLESTSTVVAFYPTANIVDFGADWFNKLSGLKRLYFYANTVKLNSIKKIIDRDVYVEDVNISNPINLDLDVTKLHFYQNVYNIVLYSGTLMGNNKSYINLYEFSSYPQLQNIMIGSSNTLVDLKNLIDKSPNLNNILISNVYDTVNREDIGLIDLTNRHFNCFVLSYNSRYKGDYTNFVRKFNDPLSSGTLSFNQNNGGGLYCYINELTGDYYRFSSTGFTGIKGDVTLCSFKFKTYGFLTDFDSSSVGNLNNLSNIKSLYGNGEISYLSLILNNVLEFDASILGNHQCKVNTVLRIISGNNLYGDISNLYLQNKAQTYDIAGINSYRVTGWVALIDNIYANKSTFNTTSKTFNCPTAMKAALTGTYQAPTGFVKGSADGTPTSSREKIFVLVNNYNWTFTNI